MKKQSFLIGKGRPVAAATKFASHRISQLPTPARRRRNLPEAPTSAQGESAAHRAELR
jgi:hypothetical protein